MPSSQPVGVGSPEVEVGSCPGSPGGPNQPARTSLGLTEKQEGPAGAERAGLGARRLRGQQWGPCASPRGPTPDRGRQRRCSPTALLSCPHQQSLFLKPPLGVAPTAHSQQGRRGRGAWLSGDKKILLILYTAQTPRARSTCLPESHLRGHVRSISRGRVVNEGWRNPRGFGLRGH